MHRVGEQALTQATKSALTAALLLIAAIMAWNLPYPFVAGIAGACIGLAIAAVADAVQARLAALDRHRA